MVSIKDQIVGGHYRLLERGSWVGPERMLWVNQGVNMDKNEPVLVLFISPEATSEQVNVLFEYLKRDQRLKVHRSGVYDASNYVVSYAVLNPVPQAFLYQLNNAWLHGQPWPSEEEPTKEKRPVEVKPSIVQRRKRLLLIAAIFLIVIGLIYVLLVVSGPIVQLLLPTPTLTPTPSPTPTLTPTPSSTSTLTPMPPPTSVP